VLIGALAFSLMASVGYILNDLFDIESDRLHPKKRHRPLAAATLSVRKALSMAALLLLGAWAIGLYISWDFFLVLSLYFGLNLFYSLKLKTIKWLDISVLSLFFIFRFYAGGLAAGVPLSNWFIITSLALFLMMGLDKRYHELSHHHNKRRAYKKQDLPLLLAYRSALMISVLVCLNLYLRELETAVMLHVAVTLTAFYGMASFLDDKREDQVKKVLNGRSLLIIILLTLVYLLIKTPWHV
jgi:4-hydroxybenzoate polyprenyltransferase